MLLIGNMDMLVGVYPIHQRISIEYRTRGLYPLRPSYSLRSLLPDVRLYAAVGLPGAGSLRNGHYDQDFSPAVLERIPRTDDRRETAISVKMALDRATDGNGAGKLLMDFYVHEVAWYAFTENERWHLERAIRRFRAELVRVGFLPPDR